LRSLLATILLAAATLALGVLAAWQFQEGSLHRFLGTPPTPVGERIYPGFQPEKAARIKLKSDETYAEFVKTPRGWEAVSPWRDRMDHRAAISILGFVTTTTALDSSPRDEIELVAAGLNGGGTDIRIFDAQGEDMARFRLGRRTPLLDLPAGETQPVPTIYLRPRESERRSHIYAATGDILPLFKNGFTYLRDHRPFALNPILLEKIRILTSQGELTLGRANPSAPWRIAKPLDLPTDPAAVKTLLEGLYDLQATKLSDRSDVTLPLNSAAPANTRIAITHFGETAETSLDILTPESPDARESLATVSDRPEAIFTLPIKPDPDLISIADLPLTVNDLRDPTLTNLNIASVRGIAIETATTPAILVSRQPPAPWAVTIGGNEQPANEQRLFDLLKAVTETRALSFETDAAPEDLSPWGLHRPILTLTFLAENSQTLSVSFGLDNSGNLFAKRKGSPTVMRLDNSFLEKIAIRPNDWRHARLWSISRVDLTTLVRTAAGEPSLELRYDFLGETWQAMLDGKDATASLDPARANFVLTTLENLQVTRWLSPADGEAAKALGTPDLTFALAQKTLDEFGDETGVRTQILTVAPDPASQTIYGKISSDPSPFTLSPETFLKLSIPLLED
jgi:hypothetical protein